MGVREKSVVITGGPFIGAEIARVLARREVRPVLRHGDLDGARPVPDGPSGRASAVAGSTPKMVQQVGRSA